RRVLLFHCVTLYRSVYSVIYTLSLHDALPISRITETAADRALRRTRHAEDEADEDRIYDRCRRHGRTLRQDRASVPAASACLPRPDDAQADHRPTAQNGRRRRPHPYDLPADIRRHRLPLLTHPDPAELSRAHRIRPTHPADLHLRSRARRQLPAHGRLRPDRDADHGAPVRGRRTHPGIQGW